MHAVVHTARGVIELNWMWLPTWIGMNANIKKDVEKKLGDLIVGMEITHANLDTMHEMVVDEIVALNPSVEGLREYLDGLKYVRIDGTEES
jgi:hypothetical protein